MQESDEINNSIISASPKDVGRKSEERTFSTSDKEMLLRTASGDSAGSNSELSPRLSHEKTKTTLFNIRLAAPKSVRLSDKFEDDEEELQSEAADKAMPKSEPYHVSWDHTAEEEAGQLVFVQHKAVKFGHGYSSTDLQASEIDVDTNDNDESLTLSIGNESPDITVTTTSKDFFSKDKQDGGIHFGKGKSDPLNRSFIKEKLASPLRKKRGSTSDPKSSEKSPLLGKPASRGSPVSSIDSALLRPASNGEEDNPMSSPLRSEESSEDDSQYLNTSEEADNVLSPSIISDDVTAACSKYSQLSEDGSSPSSPAKSIPVTGDEVEEGAGKTEPFKERDVFDHSLELGVAFTEFVDVDNFRISLGKENPHTEDTFGGRSEEHLVVLLKGGSRKSLKSYLRNSQLPAESDARRNMWENICTHLLKAGGHLFQEILDEHLPHGTDDVGLPAIVDLEHQHSYFLTTHGVKAAKMVVTVIASLSPDIISCPMLFPMSSLFLHYMSPESCFNCMQALLSSVRPQYFTQTKVKMEASKYVLRDLSKKYTKQAYALMLRSAKSVENVFDNWMWWIFRDLPFQYLVRIIDSFLLEGYKVLYRMALAIVFLFTKDSSQHGNRNSPVTNISAAISRYCVNMTLEPKKLIKVGFGIRGLTRKEIAKLHDKNEAYIRNLPAKDSIQKVVSSPSMGQISIARSFQGNNMSKHSASTILSSDMLSTIWSWIPMRLTLKRPKLLFSSEVHGTALRTLYTKSDHAPQSILVVKTADDEIFGAYCSTPWHTRHEKNKIHTSFFGTGETFVFTLQPRIEKFTWTGALGYPPDRTAELFMAGDDHMLIIGSGNGEAIYLDTMMERCTSTHCDTFDNDPLTSTTDFTCRVVEVFGFVD